MCGLDSTGVWCHSQPAYVTYWKRLGDQERKADCCLFSDFARRSCAQLVCFYTTFVYGTFVYAICRTVVHVACWYWLSYWFRKSNNNNFRRDSEVVLKKHQESANLKQKWAFISWCNKLRNTKQEPGTGTLVKKGLVHAHTYTLGDWWLGIGGK